MSFREAKVAMRDMDGFSRLGWLHTWGPRAALLSVAFGVFGVSLAACSSDGVTPACSEAQLFANRYDDDDTAEYKGIIAKAGPGEPQGLRALADNPDQDDAKLAKLASEKCVTAPGAIGTGTPSGGGSSAGGAAGAAGSN